PKLIVCFKQFMHTNSCLSDIVVSTLSMLRGHNCLFLDSLWLQFINVGSNRLAPLNTKLLSLTHLVERMEDDQRRVSAPDPHPIRYGVMEATMGFSLDAFHSLHNAISYNDTLTILRLCYVEHFDQYMMWLLCTGLIQN